MILRIPYEEVMVTRIVDILSMYACHGIYNGTMEPVTPPVTDYDEFWRLR